MGNIISVLYILAFAGCGILTARPIFASDRPLKRILFGLTFGLVMLLWLPVLFAFILDFTLAAQILALAAAVFIAGVSTFFAVKKQKNGKIKYKAASKRDLVPLLVTIVPLVAVGWILHANHTITNASDGSLHVGQCTFGDLCMHLSFITSISVQKRSRRIIRFCREPRWAILSCVTASVRLFIHSERRFELRQCFPHCTLFLLLCWVCIVSLMNGSKTHASPCLRHIFSLSAEA